MTLAGKNDDGRLGSVLGVDSTGVEDLAPPNKDIIEAPSREVPIPGGRVPIKFGTVGSGLDVVRSVWPSEEHMFSSQTIDLRTVLPHRPLVHEVGPPNRVPPGILAKHPVDVILLDSSDGSFWEHWLTKVPAATRPRVLALASTPDGL
jgi:hypothetical protein